MSVASILIDTTCTLVKLKIKTFPHRGFRQVKLADIRQSKIIKGLVLAGLGRKGLRKRDGQIGSVNPFPPRGSPLMSKIVRC